jgi:multidrug resistance efflux pump
MNDHVQVEVVATGAGARPGAESLRDRVRALRLPEPSGRGNPRGAWLPWLLCLLLAASTGYLGYQHFNAAPAETARADEDRPAAPASAATPAAATPAGAIAFESKGYLVPSHLILVSPKVGGMVLKLHIREEGQRFKKDEVLAELETTEYQSDHDRARAALESARQRLLELERGNRPEEIESAKAELNEAEAQREQLYLDWKRNVNLKTGNALAQRDYEQAQSSYLAMDRRVARLRQAYKLMVEGPRRERIDAARADLRLAEAELAKAKWRLDNCLVRSPVTGTVLSKKAEEGNMVNPSAFSNGLSASLCEMADLSELEVELDIQERDIAKVYRGQRCRVRAEAYPERVYEGVVSRLMPIANRAKGAVPVRVTVAVPRVEVGVYLKPEMGAIVTFLGAEDKR